MGDIKAVPKFDSLRAVFRYMNEKDPHRQGFIESKNKNLTEEDKNLFKLADKDYGIFGGNDKLTPWEIIESMPSLGLTAEDLSHIQRTRQLLENLRSDDEGLHESAKRGLEFEAKNEAVLETLIYGLSDRSPELRLVVAEILGKSAKPSVLHELVLAFQKGDQDSKVPILHGFSFSSFMSSEMFQVLTQAIHDADSAIRIAAIHALGNTAPNKNGDELLILAVRDFDPKVREAAVAALEKKGNIKGLLLALKDSEKDLQQKAANALGGLKNPEKFPTFELIHLLNGADSEIQCSLVSLLGELRDTRAVSALITLYNQYPQNRVLRSYIISALGKIQGSMAMSKLLAILKTGEDDLRAEAALALGSPSFQNAVHDLIVALENDEGLLVRKNAATALGQIGSDRASSALQKAWSSDHANQKSIELALDEIRSASARTARVQNPAPVGPYPYAVAGTDDFSESSAVPLSKEDQMKKLISVLQSGEEAQRLQAVDSTPKGISAAGLEQILKSLKTDPSPNVRLHIIKALMPIKNGNISSDQRAQIEDHLIDVLQNDANEKVRSNAAIALGNMKSQKAIPVLQESLENPALQKSAQRALSKIQNQDTSVQTKN